MRIPLLIGTLWLGAVPLPAQDPVESSATPSAENLSAGERLFESQYVRCHGVGGTGGAGPAFTQPKLRRAVTDSELVAVIQNGVPGTAMVGFWNLKEDEAREVAAYVRSLGRRPPEVLPGAVAAGRLRPLWHFQAGGAINANPIAFSLDGRQHVAVAAGSALVVFALAETPRAGAGS